MDKYAVLMNNNLTVETDALDAEIAAQITELASAKGVTHEALAQAIGFSITSLRRCLEQHRGDRRSFSMRELARAADLLGVSPNDLLPASLMQMAAA